MNLLNVGKIVNTFGIKGELKIVSRFEMPERAFKVGNTLLINNKEYLITGYRFHHHNYLIELDNMKDINLVTNLIGYDVFIDEKLLKLNNDEYIISELIDYEVYNSDKLYGKVNDYDNNEVNPLIKVNSIYIPLKSKYFNKVDKEKRIIYCKDLEELEI